MICFLKMLRRLASLPLPVFGMRFALGCGVLGLVYHKRNARLGELAAELLRVLEYRGYDSTGAAIQDGDTVTLRKAPGAPSEICGPLGIPELAGEVFCGQVRWATFGAVDALNAQPHDVHCKRHIYGAHNGNISNAPNLKQWLLEQGHDVCSDNDGEMLVHLIEHLYDEELRQEEGDRRAAMRRAIVRAGERVQGSYAAVVVIPEERVMYAIKAGSSLYLGLSTEGAENPFVFASSDYTSVLKLTRLVVPLRRGQFVEYDAEGYQVYAAADLSLRDEEGQVHHHAAGEAIEVEPRYSTLQIGDIQLRDDFEYFMDQEIADEAESAARLVRYFSLGSERLRAFREALKGSRLLLSAAENQLQALTMAQGPQDLQAALNQLFGNDPLWELFSDLPEAARSDHSFYSDHAALLSEAWSQSEGHPRREMILLADLYAENDEINSLNTHLIRFVEDARHCIEQGGQIYAVCSGTSYNAARTGALFFNDLCGVKFVPLLPGEYRGQYNHCLCDRDLLITISQSGETKDVIDVVDDVLAKSPEIRHLSLVNNMNSTLAQEKADYAIPLRCGPEIAVPATKSFINQLTILYGMALYLAAALGGRPKNGERRRHEGFSCIISRRERLAQIPQVLKDTWRDTEQQVEEAARLLYLAPSLHILATRMWGVAREGALKIREVVLNHAEGIEATEFKHGPNTILGRNTGYGMDQVWSFVSRLGKELHTIGAGSQQAAELLERISKELMDEGTVRSLQGLPGCENGLFDSLDRDYPLVYITGPGKRDVELTITQINTHKIRGASTIVIAEPDDNLIHATLEAPMGHKNYRGIFIPLPSTGDMIYTTFSSILVLQRLALRMCLRKMQLLDTMGIKEHGVHPDSPKNVSKSITVD